MQKTLLFVVMCALSLGFLGAPAHALETSAPLSKQLIASDIIASVNKERLAKGLPMYKENLVLTRAAELKAKSLVTLGTLQHTSSSNGALWWPLVQAGYEYTGAGENLAQGISDPNELVLDWMNSSAHRANIVNPNYTEIGVSVMMGMNGGYPVPYVVLYAGTPKPALAQSKVLSASNDAQIQMLMQKIIGLLNLIIQMKAQGLS